MAGHPIDEPGRRKPRRPRHGGEGRLREANAAARLPKGFARTAHGTPMPAERDERPARPDARSASPKRTTPAGVIRRAS